MNVDSTAGSEPPSAGPGRGSHDPGRELDRRVDSLLDTCDPRRTSAPEFRGAQYDMGLAWVHFPPRLGGLGVPAGLQARVDRRLEAAGAPPVGSRQFFGVTMAAPTILTHGGEDMAQRFLRRAFSGQDVWCQLFSEPNAGSDLANVGSQAKRDGDRWTVTGQKVWNTYAHFADRAMLLVRSDPAVPKHKGMTFFALDMHTPGIEVRPLMQMTGDAEFNEVFLNEVVIPDTDRIGAVGQGWQVAMTTLLNERTTIGTAGGASGSGSGPIAEAVRIWRDSATGRSAATRDRLMRLWCEAEVLRLTNLRDATRRQLGNPGPEGSIAKLWFAELNQRIYELCMDLLGPAATVGFSYTMERVESFGIAVPGAPRQMFLRSRANSIEGGTSEIQRNVLAERLLGLPTEPRNDKHTPWSQASSGHTERAIGAGGDG